MKREDFTFFVEQPLLKEPCPCGSKAKFGSCCGGHNACDCKSHLLAQECCFKDEEEEISPPKRNKSQLSIR